MNKEEKKIEKIIKAIEDLKKNTNEQPSPKTDFDRGYYMGLAEALYIVKSEWKRIMSIKTVIILFISLFMLSCSSVGCYQSFHFVSGIKQKDMIVGTAIAYFPPSAGKINYNDWDIIQKILEEQLEVPQGYVAILPSGVKVCCDDDQQTSINYMVKNINIIKGVK